MANPEQLGSGVVPVAAAEVAAQVPPMEPQVRNGKRERPIFPLENLVYECDEFSVWLDKRLDVWWQTEDCFEKKMEELQRRPEWGEILGRQTELEALPMSHLSDELKRGFRFQIANAILMLFTEKSEHAKKGMAAAEAFYRARTAEQARMWILQAGLLSVGVVTISLGVSGWLGKAVVLESGNLFEEVMLGAFAGAWGAGISLMSRASVLGIDATAGKRLHYMESIRRTVTGFVAGGVMVCAMAAGVVAPGLMKFGPPMLIVLGFTAGFSERLLPRLVGKMEAAVRVTNHAPAGRGKK